MSKALELAKNYARYCLLRGGITYSPQFDELAKELRRLAQVEAEHAALLKAISDAEPVAQIRMSDGGLSVVNRVTTKGVQVSVHRIDGDWTPLYTLNGIKP